MTTAQRTIAGYRRKGKPVSGYRQGYQPAAEASPGRQAAAGWITLGGSIALGLAYAVQLLASVLGLATAIITVLSAAILGSAAVTPKGRTAVKRTTTGARASTARAVQRRRQPASQVERWQRRDLRRERRHERNTRMWAALQQRRQQHRVVATERDMALSLAAQSGLARNRRRAARAAQRAREWLRNDPGERPTEMSQASLDLHEFDRAERKGEAA